MCCWAHVVAQERLEFRSHMAQESGDGKKDSTHILSLFLFCFVFLHRVHSLVYYFIWCQSFLQQKNYRSFLSQPCFAVFFFWGAFEGKGFQSKAWSCRDQNCILKHPTHVEVEHSSIVAIIFCCDGAKSKWLLLARKLETPMWQIRELVIWKHAYYIYIASSSSTW